jgi:uncharacterized membrane protein YqjE
VTDSDKKPAPGLFGRLLRVIGMLLEAHVEAARVEAKSDLQRLLGGVFLLAAALLLVAIAVILGHGLLVWGVRAWGQTSWPAAGGVVAIADLLFALLFVTVGRGMLQRPILAKTRALLRRSVGILAGE